jgi:LacI family transcriptional regulator
MSTPKKVTLKEIAEQTGLTRMAVSLALRNKPGVSEGTRAKVMKIAERLGYEPDPEVSNLMARIRATRPKETKASIALLTLGAPTGNTSTTEKKYIQGVVERAGAYGYRVEDFRIEENGMSPARVGDILWSRGIEGVIVRPLQYGLSSYKSREILFDFERFSSVAISETFTSPELDRSVHDQYTAMVMVMNGLTRMNYQKIGLVLEQDLSLRVNGKWNAAYLHFPYFPGAGKGLPPLILDGFRPKEFDKWFSRHRPDVIVSVDRFGLRLALDHGLDIPGEVGYASLDLDGELSEYPDMTGIDQNSHLVGAAAVDMLVLSMQRKQRGVPVHPMRIEVGGIWKAGNSAVMQESRA